MPGFNRKGPEGKGPMTGRALGRCGNKGQLSNAPESNPSDDLVRPLRLRRRDQISGAGPGRGRSGGWRNSGRNS